MTALSREGRARPSDSIACSHLQPQQLAQYLSKKQPPNRISWVGFIVINAALTQLITSDPLIYFLCLQQVFLLRVVVMTDIFPKDSNRRHKEVIFHEKSI